MIEISATYEILSAVDPDFSDDRGQILELGG